MVTENVVMAFMVALKQDSEKQLKECEWRLHLLERMLTGFTEIGKAEVRRMAGFF